MFSVYLRSLTVIQLSVGYVFFRLDKFRPVCYRFSGPHIASLSENILSVFCERESGLDISLKVLNRLFLARSVFAHLTLFWLHL